MNAPEALDLSDTIIPKSDQMNADDLHGGPIVITITRVTRGESSDQPVSIHYEGGEGRPFKPCKTMRKILVHAWGNNGADWIGKSMQLFCDPEVQFGGIKVGGIRISHLSNIEGDFSLPVNKTRGKKERYSVKVLRPVRQSASAVPAPSQEVERMSIDQVTSINDLLAEKELQPQALCAAATKALGWEVKSVADLPVDFYQRAAGWIEAH